MALKSEGYAKEYWKDQALSDKVYYYDCKLNFFKKLFSKTILGILMKAID